LITNNSITTWPQYCRYELMAVLVGNYSFGDLYKNDNLTIDPVDVEFCSNKLRCTLQSNGYIYLNNEFGENVFCDYGYKNDVYQYCFVFNCPIKQQHTIREPEIYIKQQIDNILPISKHNRIYILQNQFSPAQFGLIVDIRDTLFIFKIGSKFCKNISIYCKDTNHMCKKCYQCCDEECYHVSCGCDYIYRYNHIDFNTLQYINLSMDTEHPKYNEKHEIHGHNNVGIVLLLTTTMTIDSNTSISTNVGILKPTGYSKYITGDDGDPDSEPVWRHVLYYNLIDNYHITNYSNLFEYSRKVRNEDELKIKSVTWIKLNLSDNKEFMLRLDPACSLSVEEIKFPKVLNII
jgi:hypothetical protein